MNIETIRCFKKQHKIPKYIWTKIFKEIRYTPSSFNLQPWFFFVIESEFNKNKLKECLIGNKVQLETSSAMVLLCGNMNKIDLSEKIYNSRLENKEITIDQKKFILEQIRKQYNFLDQNSLKNELFLELGIISLHFIIASQDLGYNCCYIGGCHFNKLNNLFNIPFNYLPIILIAIGKKVESEEIVKKSFKLEPEDFVKFL
ncbi:MAG: nitroreductase [Candidatus Phytoplasma cynodontis]|uniref:nitroreductase family protein n=1 Tax='Cynodon dactylon' phytoplasma TaxID=295320 RepID=UPI001265BDAB|nr:nitroreductase family protein ['Cynodon dactylon' phytoplasma]KAB8122020.1 nitroreductase ['Cynodon dactylon' phytoplasma]WIA07563.1 MAG: nitroreductase [Candidatus Phytoplasma cynodontis]